MAREQPRVDVKRQGLDLVRSLELPAVDMDKVLSGNAKRLLKLN